jgi:hypothetical protein
VLVLRHQLRHDLPVRGLGRRLRRNGHLQVQRNEQP